MRARVDVTGSRRSADLLALHHHVQEVRTDAAPLEPRLAPAFDRQRIDLAEVGRSFDGRAGEAELRSGRLVVDARVAGVLLLGQHLRRRSQRPDQCLAVTSDLGAETHRLILPDQTIAMSFRRDSCALPLIARTGDGAVRWQEAGP